jgi:uncharacterized protein (TIGR03437 family)
MAHHAALLVACSLTFLSPGFAQGPQIITLTIGTQDRVQYRDDLTDKLRVGTEAGVTAWRPASNFYPLVDISDITEINGKPARGMVVLRGMGFNVARDAQAGQAIADSPGRVAVYDGHFDILDVQGRPVGSITLNGIGGGPQAPGLPSGFGTLTITGGTGAFLGVKGQLAFVVPQGVPGSSRLASMAEDPAKRRINGGNPGGWFIQLIPLFRPEITMVSGSPAIFHGDDFSPVSSGRPARAGELLIASVTGLGAVRDQTALGESFLANEIAEVVSPVGVLVNDKEAEVVNKIGWPGTTDRYRIDFRIPSGVAPRTAKIQLTAAWIPGPTVDIPVQ